MFSMGKFDNCQQTLSVFLCHNEIYCWNKLVGDKHVSWQRLLMKDLINFPSILIAGRGSGASKSEEAAETTAEMYRIETATQLLPGQ
jgi:hypothetical protein